MRQAGERLLEGRKGRGEEGEKEERVRAGVREAGGKTRMRGNT